MEKCNIEGCERDKYCKGMCKAHYDQIRKAGRITHKILPPPVKCKVPDCNRDAVCSGYCKKHNEQFTRNGKIFKVTTHDKNEIIIKNKYAEIVLYNRKCEEIARTKIDIEDLEKVTKYRCGTTKGYVYIQLPSGRQRLHRFIMNAPNNMVVDHINHNTLDNRKNNLRICTIQQNSMYRVPIGKSGVSGVYWVKKLQKWKPSIKVNDKTIHLGTYKTKEEAIKVRKEAELKYFGEYSYLNRDKVINSKAAE